MGLRQQAAKGVVWSAAQSWGARAISFLITLVLARLLSPDAFGLVAFATVFTAFAEIFLDQGFGDAIVQFQQLDREHLDTAFWTNLIAGLLLTIIGILVSRPLEHLFNKPQLAIVLGYLSLNFLIGSLSTVQQAFLKRRLDFKKLAIRSLIATLISGAVAIIMAIRGFGVWSLVAKVIVNSLVSVAVLWRVSDWRPGLHFSIRHLKEIYNFGIHIVGSNFVDFFSRNSDNFLIGFFLGTTALGYYAIAYNLLVAMTGLLIEVPNAVIFPTFSRLQAEPTRVKQAFYEVTQLLSTIAFPIFLGMIVLAPDAIIIIYGEQWISSIPVIQVLMLMGIFFSGSYFFGNVIKAAGRPSWRFGILSLLSILNVIGFMIAVHWGIVAVAGSYVIVGYLIFPIYFLVCRRLLHISIRTYLQQYIPAFTSSLAMIAVILGLRIVLNGEVGLYIRVFISISLGGLVYLAVLYLIKPSIFRYFLSIAHLVLPQSQSKTL